MLVINKTEIIIEILHNVIAICVGDTSINIAAIL